MILFVYDDPASDPPAPAPPGWVFDDPPNLACFSIDRVARGGEPIRQVVHDAEGSWQFLDGGDLTGEQPLLLGLIQAIEIDPSLAELADLPRGWSAWRDEPGAAWERHPTSQ